MCAIVPIVVIVMITNKFIGDALIDDSSRKLTAIREAKGFQLENLYSNTFAQVSSIAQSKVTSEALERFDSSFYKYENEVDVSDSTLNESLQSFYKDQFGKTFEESNLNKTFDRFDEIFSKLSRNEKLLQYAFISSNENSLGEKDKLYKLSNSSTYSKDHEAYHPTYRTYLNKFGFYDIFMVDAKKGHVIYSVYKELDFATNLNDGAYADSGIAQAYKKALTAKSKDDVFITTLAKYYPSYNAPAQFISAPVYKGESIIGALIFQLPVAKIDEILTGKNSWKEHGLGNSGEVYIVNEERIMQSVSRFLVEDKEGFLDLMGSINLSQEKRDYIQSKDTTALSLVIDSLGAKDVVTGKTYFSIFPDYRGVNVLSAYRPLNIKGLNWYILSEMDEEEALENLSFVQKIIGLSAGIFIVLILVFSYFFSNQISKSFTLVTDKLKETSTFLLNLSGDISTNASELSSMAQEQASSIQQTSASVNEISAMVTRSSNTAKNSEELAQSSELKAEEGKKSVLSTKTKIEEIDKSNKILVKKIEENNLETESIIKIIEEISEKTSVINDIVFQTKLLSFNASVEAARAGEMGKGFAVVAEEVGNLATMSGTAANEITELLEKSISQVKNTVNSSKAGMESLIDTGSLKVNEGLQSISSCDESLNQILSSFKEVKNAVLQIANSSAEQAAGVNEINAAIIELDNSTQKNSSLAETSSRDAVNLKNEANDLVRLVGDIEKVLYGKAS